MAYPRRYDPEQLIAAGFDDTPGSIAAACRVLGWPPKNVTQAVIVARRLLADRTIATAAPTPVASLTPAAMPAFSLPNFPPSSVEPYRMPSIRTDEPLADIGDVHLPAHAKPFLDRMASRVIAEHVAILIHAGDTLNADQLHRRSMHSFHERSFEDDLDLGSDYHTEWARWVRRQIVLMGNHERWLKHRMGGYLKEATLYRKWLAHLGEQVEVIDGEAIEIIHCGQRWVSVHGTSAAQNIIAVMERYAWRWKANIIMHHVHQTAMAEKWGFRLVCIGGGHDPDRLLYAHESPRPLAPMTQAFVILRRGEPTVYRASDPTW